MGLNLSGDGIASMGVTRVFHSGDGLWIEADVKEAKGGTAGIVVTGGIHDIRSTMAKAVLLRLRSQPNADPKKLIQSARELVTSYSGHTPLVMPPTFASGWIDFRFERESTMDPTGLVDALAAHFAGIKIAKPAERIIDGRNLRKKQKETPASELLTLGRERTDIDAETFTPQQIDNIFNEIESDYGAFLRRTLNLLFARTETKRRLILGMHWEASYTGDEIKKSRTADLSLAAHRASRRVEHTVVDSPGVMGRILGKEPVSRKITELELTSEFESVRVLLVAGSYMEKARYDETGRIHSGGLKDIAIKSDGSTASGEQNTLVDQEIKPDTLSKLDSAVKDALVEFSKQCSITFGVR